TRRNRLFRRRDKAGQFPRSCVKSRQFIALSAAISVVFSHFPAFPPSDAHICSAARFLKEIRHGCEA
ncbi:MAG: hypothetical protein KGL12_14330, partial [Rhodospirillales bacterium]|nr:hypothetical protein [Rhodospirillales bacterium]